MHDLIPITALGADAAQINEFAGLTLREFPGVALASVAMRPGQEARFHRAAKKAVGVSLPGPGRGADGNDSTIFWTGQDQWMVEAPFASHEDLAARLSSALKDTAAVTEQTDGWARFDLEGTGCVAVLQRLTPADSAMMTAGAVTRTAIEHLGCLLMCRREQIHFSILCPRSGAASLHHGVCAAALSAL